MAAMQRGEHAVVAPHNGFVVGVIAGPSTVTVFGVFTRLTLFSI